MIKAYFANGLFSQADFDFNEKCVKALREKIDELDIYLPQENTAINDKTQFANSRQIYEADTKKLLQSDILFAVIDGETIDAGVACEIGIAVSHGIPVFAIQTDSRRFYFEEDITKQDTIKEVCESQYKYTNLFVVGAIKKKGFIVNSIEDLVEETNEIVSPKQLELFE